jgi:hypothetical protein
MVLGVVKHAVVVLLLVDYYCRTGAGSGDDDSDGGDDASCAGSPATRLSLCRLAPPAPPPAPPPALSLAPAQSRSVSALRSTWPHANMY